MMKYLITRLPPFFIPVITTLLGLVIGVGLIYIVTLIERRGSWEQFDTPPAAIDQLVAANQNYVIVETTDRTFYKVYCQAEDPGDICWQAIEPPVEAIELPCHDDDPLPPPAPGPVQDQIESCFHFEYISLTHYALLEDGTLWHWGVMINPLGQVVRLVWTVIIGAVLGALVGIVVVIS